MRGGLAALLTLALSYGESCAAGPGPSGRGAGPKAVAAGREVRLLALGDSFTIGTGVGPQAAFPARLSAHLNDDGAKVTLKNLGKNGYTTQDLIDRELPQAAAFRPTLVTLAIGANDIVQGSTESAYRGQVRRILRGIVKLGVAPDHVLVLPQPDWPHSPAAALLDEPAVLDQKARAFNQILRAEAEQIGAIYIDLSLLMQRQARDGQLAPDGLHPSAQAHEEWAEALRRVLVDGLDGRRPRG